MAITLPIVLIIIDLYPLERFFWEGRRAVAEKAPFFALGVLFAGVTVWAQETGGAIGTIEAHPLGTRLLVAVRSVAFYLYKTVWPVDLAPYYTYPARASLLNPEYAGAVILFIVITLACVLALKRTRLFAAAWAYYLVTLTPVAGIVQVGSQAAADRYTYLPGLAPTALVAAGAALLLIGSGKRRVIGAVVAAVLYALYSLTAAQIPVWKDSVRLWTHVIQYYEYTPEADAARVLAYYNRAKAYDEAGQPGPAIDDYDRVIILSPGNANAYINRGAAHARAGSLKRALWDFDSAIRLAPEDADAYHNRGLARLALGDIDPAITDLTAAAGLRPGFVAAYLALEQAYTISGDKEKALAAKERSLALDGR
jgi:tetratricopeptide (TPR) repeat protein